MTQTPRQLDQDTHEAAIGLQEHGAMPRPSVLAKGLLWLVGGYQRRISPILPPACRFYPSCSHYAVQALHWHAVPRALGLILWRLLRCQPFSAAGFDPVPLPPALSPSGQPCTSDSLSKSS